MIGLLVHAAGRGDDAMVAEIETLLEHPPARPEAELPVNSRSSGNLRRAVDDAEWVWWAALGTLARRGGREQAIYHRLALVRLANRGDLG